MGKELLYNCLDCCLVFELAITNCFKGTICNFCSQNKTEDGCRVLCGEGRGEWEIRDAVKLLLLLRESGGEP